MSRYVVVKGAILECSKGNAQMPLRLTRRPYTINGRAIATVDDCVFGRDVGPFGLCDSIIHPSVAAVLASTGNQTPMPCVSPQVFKWQPGADYVSQDVAAVAAGASAAAAGGSGTSASSSQTSGAARGAEGESQNETPRAQPRVLTSDSKCHCIYNGDIKVVAPGSDVRVD